MDSNREKILYIAIAAIVLLGGFFIYRQELAIRDLKTEGPASTQDSKQSLNQAEDTKKQVLAARQINGVVKEVGGNFLIIEATLVDISKLDGFDFSKSSLLPSVKKNYKVFVDQNTDIASGTNAPFKLSDIKSGRSIQAFSNEEIYDKDQFIALRLNVFLQ